MAVLFGGFFGNERVDDIRLTSPPRARVSLAPVPKISSSLLMCAAFLCRFRASPFWRRPGAGSEVDFASRWGTSCSCALSAPTWAFVRCADRHCSKEEKAAAFNNLELLLSSPPFSRTEPEKYQPAPCPAWLFESGELITTDFIPVLLYVAYRYSSYVLLAPYPSFSSARLS
jgi:hypothetical protein